MDCVVVVGSWLLVVNLFTVLYDKSKSKIILFVVVAFGIT